MGSLILLPGAKTINSRTLLYFYVSSSNMYVSDLPKSISRIYTYEVLILYLIVTLLTGLYPLAVIFEHFYP